MQTLLLKFYHNIFQQPTVQITQEWDELKTCKSTGIGMNYDVKVCQKYTNHVQKMNKK